MNQAFNSISNPLVINEFKNITWLKQTIKQLKLEGKAWPTKILNVKTKTAFRPNVEGPYSLFLNLRGESLCQTGNHAVKLNEDFYFLSNTEQNYTLKIDNPSETEVFNIHFGDDFFVDVFQKLQQKDGFSLENPFEKRADLPLFHNQLYKKDAAFEKLIQDLYFISKNQIQEDLLYKEKLSDLIFYLLQKHQNILKKIEKLPANKQSTKAEIHKRLSLSIDFIFENYQQKIDLATLSEISCLSKFHYLRLFKQFFGKSPYQFIIQLRLEKAKELLQKTNFPIQNIADGLGFQNLSSFSRLFRQRMSVYPSEFRRVA